MTTSYNVSGREQMLNDLVHAVSGRKGKCVFTIAIDGCACSGKSMLAAELTYKFNDRGDTAIALSLDDFCNPSLLRYQRSEPNDLQVYMYNFDLQRFANTVRQFQQRTDSVAYEIFNVLEDRFDRVVRTSGHELKVLICEGIQILRPELSELFDFTIFMEIEPEEQMRRAYARDPGRGKSIQEIAYKYAQRYRPSFEYHVETNRPRCLADCVINNNSIFEPKLVRLK